MKFISQLAHCCILLFIFHYSCHAQIKSDYMMHGGMKDKSGSLWFATTGAGVYRYDHVTGVFSNFTKVDGLCDNNVSSIMEDKAGNIWFATAYGVCRLSVNSSGDKQTDYKLITPKDGPCNYDINCMLEDRHGNFWFGTNGYGVCRYNSKLNKLTHFTKEHGLGSNAVQCILEDKSGNLWFGERAGGVCRFDSASNRFKQIGSPCFSSQIMGMVEDKKGNIWFANLYSGLCRLDVSTGTYTHILRMDGLCKDSITGIYQDKKGNLWLGMDFNGSSNDIGGVCRYNPESGVSTHFTSRDGFRHIDVWTVVEDNAGKIWIGSRGGGLSRYDPDTNKFTDFSEAVK